MLFWIIAVLIALAVAAILAFAMLRGRHDDVQSADVAMYRDQLAEVDRDLARGTIDAEEAARAKTEVARRLLAADRAAVITGAEAPASATKVMVVIIAAVLVVGSAVAYIDIGRPGYADMPLEQRLAEAEAKLANLPAQAALEADAAPLLAGNILTPPDDIAANVEALRAAVAANPEALSETALLREFEAGVRNFPAAARLTQGMLPYLEGDDLLNQKLVLIELWILAANGQVSAEGADLLAEIAREIPDHPAVIMYRGILMDNIGRADLAFALWRPLLESGETSPYHERMRQLMPQVAWTAGVTYDVPPAPAALRAPDAAAVAATEGMNDAQRDAMIAGMVEQLASRLATQGGSPAEWAQLINALGVTGDLDRARAIWTEARTTFADDPALAEIDAAAAAAGLELAQ